MLTEVLHVSVLYGNGSANPIVPEILGNIPKVKLLCQAQEPRDLESQGQWVSSDCVLVYLDGVQALPDWLEDLTVNQPQTSVMLCSAKMESEFLIRAMQMGVREILPLPLVKPDLEAAFERLRAARRRISDPMVRKGKVLAVTGHKGGVGITTIAVNLAIALAEMQSEKVALVDLGRPFPDVSNFLDQDAPYNIFALIRNAAELDHGFLQKIIQPYEGNLAILPGISDFKEQDSIDLDALDKIFALLRPLYKWIIVDLSHWLDDLFLKVLGEADLAVFLTALTVPDLRNLGNLWPILKDWQLLQDKVKLVINRYDKASSLSLRSLDQVVREPVFATLPVDFQASTEAINRGVPLAKVAPNSKLWLGIRELAQKLNQQVQTREEADSNGARPRRRFWIF
jgi:pilus assembly protein CpaE